MPAKKGTSAKKATAKAVPLKAPAKTTAASKKPRPDVKKSSRTVITVTHVGWRVGDETLPSKARAVKYARAEARKIHKAGGLAQVVVKNRKGRIETEWSYGDDPKHRKG